MKNIYDTISIIDALRHVKKFTGTTVLIKLGGSILEDKNLIKTLCEDFILLKSSGIRIIIVHGGSKAINIALDKYKIKTIFLDGLRVTTMEAMNIIEMVLCGNINNLLVRNLNFLGVNAIGLSGVDGNMLLCNYYSTKHGYVGKIKDVNLSLIKNILDIQYNDSNLIPIISPIGVDSNGNALNINADWVASAIAVSLNVQKLIYLTDQNGIKDVNGKVIPKIYTDEMKTMVEKGIVKDGMLTKTNAIIGAIENGINQVHVINGKINHSLLTEIFTTAGIGTICKKTTY